MSNDSKALYRNRRFVAPSNTTRLSWLLDAPGPQQSPLDEAVVFSGALSPSAEALFSHHVVGGAIILPGVGYVELAFAASSGRALAAVAFLRPCSLSGPGRGKKCVLRCTQSDSQTLEIVSKRTSNASTDGGSFVVNFTGAQESTHNVQFVERITTYQDVRSHFLKAGNERELQEEPDTLEFRRLVSGQKQIGQPLYEPVLSWSDAIAQAQEMRPSLRAHGKEDEYSR